MVTASTAASKASSLVAKKAPIKLESMSPVPTWVLKAGEPYGKRARRVPSVTMSTSPDKTITEPSFSAASRATFSRSALPSPASIPWLCHSTPAKVAISPALPRMTVKWYWWSSSVTTRSRYMVAPQATGSKTVGLWYFLAASITASISPHW